MPELLLVPPESTGLEKALDYVSNRLLDARTELIRESLDPDLVQDDLLPFLAYHRGVDLWFEDWPEWKKRKMLRDIYALKAKKGTLVGMSGYLSFLDATINEAILPPQGVILRPYNPQRLEEFRKQFVELRISTFNVRGARPGFVLRGTVSGSPNAIIGKGVIQPNNVGLNYGRRAVLYQDGVEIPIWSQDQIRLDANGVEVDARVLAVPVAARKTEAQVDGPLRIGRIVAHGRTVGRLITIGNGGLYQGAVPMERAGMRVIDADPERVMERHPASGREAVVGKAVVGKSIVRSGYAERFIYDRWYLYDPDRARDEAIRYLAPVIGRMIPSLRPFNAFLRIDANFRRHGSDGTASRFRLGRDAMRQPSDRIDRVGLAVNISKSLRDRTQFSTSTFRPRELRDLSFDQPAPWGGMVPIAKRTT